MNEQDKIQLAEDKLAFDMKCLFQTNDLQQFQAESEKLFIIEKLKKYNWNVSRTAKALNIWRGHLYTKINNYNLKRP